MRMCINLTSLCSNIFPPSIICYRAFNSVRRSKISDYYDVLGVPSSANSDELKRAFYAMSKKYHPDLNGTNEASAQKFLEVKVAYDTLKDEEKRREYDSRMCTATQEMRPPPHFTANRPRQRHSQSNTSSPMARQMFLQRILFMHSHNPAMEEFNRERQWRRIKLFATGFLIFLASYYYFIRIVHSGK